MGHLVCTAVKRAEHQFLLSEDRRYRSVTKIVADKADGEVGRETTAREVGHLAEQLKSHVWGKKSESPC